MATIRYKKFILKDNLHVVLYCVELIMLGERTTEDSEAGKNSFFFSMTFQHDAFLREGESRESRVISTSSLD